MTKHYTPSELENMILKNFERDDRPISQLVTGKTFHRSLPMPIKIDTYILIAGPEAKQATIQKKTKKEIDT